VGTLFVVATPIGNLEDFSPRAIRILREVSLIAAEDTRHSRKLLAHFGIDTPLISYHQHNRRERQDRLLEQLRRGAVALIADAGTPGISDPGVDLVRAAHAAGHTVTPIPGPSALAAAVSASGLIDGPFLTVGFLPRERVPRRLLIARVAASNLPFVLFEAPRRLGGTLRELAATLGDRPAVVSRELTKLHEEVQPGSLRSLQDWARSSTLRGEVVLVVGGAAARRTSGEDVRDTLATLRRAGLSISEAAREAATMTGLPRSELYQLAITLQETSSVRLEGELALPDENALQDALGDQKRPEG
jgi:16S rRNA (cytidine1402-2'-O)-methyltransferase